MLPIKYFIKLQNYDDSRHIGKKSKGEAIRIVTNRRRKLIQCKSKSKIEEAVEDIKRVSGREEIAIDNDQ